MRPAIQHPKMPAEVIHISLFLPLPLLRKQQHIVKDFNFDKYNRARKEQSIAMWMKSS